MMGAFVVAGVGYCASFYVPIAVVIAESMESQKSLGMGIVLGATSIGAAVFSVLIGRAIETQGWRLTTEGLAVVTVAMLPWVWLTVQPKDVPQYPLEMKHA